MNSVDREILSEAGRILTDLRIASPAEGVVVSLGVHGPSIDCDAESFSVGVLWNGQTFTGNSVELESAVGIARAKIAAEKDRLSKEAAKRAKPKPPTAMDRAHQALETSQ